VSAATESAAIGSANVAASAANSDDSKNNSSYCEVIDERPAGNKGKTPFICLPGNVPNLLSNKLNTKCSKVNPNSSSTETMRMAMQSLVRNREYLVGLAGGLDATMRKGGGLRADG